MRERRSRITQALHPGYMARSDEHPYAAAGAAVPHSRAAIESSMSS